MSRRRRTRKLACTGWRAQQLRTRQLAFLMRKKLVKKMPGQQVGMMWK
jgi:hypothetical protein